MLLTCLGQGFQLPKALLGRGFLRRRNSTGDFHYETYGISRRDADRSPPGISTPEECIFWFGQEGLYSPMRQGNVNM